MYRQYCDKIDSQSLLLTVYDGDKSLEFGCEDGRHSAVGGGGS